MNKVYEYNGENIVGFCFALYKEDWKPIPKELQLRYGDNYIYEEMKHNILWGGNIHHWESRTLLSEEQKEKCLKIIEQDKINWITIKNGLRCKNS